jgi:hypothetical protein
MEKVEDFKVDGQLIASCEGMDNLRWIELCAWTLSPAELDDFLIWLQKAKKWVNNET